MEIQVAKFRDALKLLKPVVPRKSALKSLNDRVMLHNGQVVATDLETIVAVGLPTDISCIIPYSDLVKVLEYIPGSYTLRIEQNDSVFMMTWLDGGMNLPTESVEDFPPFPEFVASAEALLDIDTLIPAMLEVLTYASTETSRPTLSGVTLIVGEHIEVAAGDGFRMAHRILPLSFPGDAVLIVPSSSVRVLKLLLDKTPRAPKPSDSFIATIMSKRQATVAIDEKHVGLKFTFPGPTTAIVKLIQGNPPAWVKLIPKDEPKLVVSVMGSELELAMRRVRNVAKDHSGIVRMVFNGNTATISAGDGSKQVQSTIGVLANKGDSGRIGLNSAFLLDYLKGKEGIMVISLQQQEMAPVAFKYQRGPTVLIMPMHVDWEKPAAPAAAAAPEAETAPTVQATAEAAPAAPAEGTTEAAAK